LLAAIEFDYIKKKGIAASEELPGP